MSREAGMQGVYHTAIRAAMLGLALNVLLGVVKLVAGVVSGSVALLADAVNSVGDALTSLAVVGALHWSQRPADAEHPYGHTRAEAVAATNVAVIIILSALWVGWEAITRLGQANTIPPAWTLLVAGGNIIIKEALYWYKVSVGRRTGSMALIANAWDHRSDALCSLAVFIGLGVVILGGEGYLWADKVAALVVVAAILWSGGMLFRHSFSNLLDRQAEDGLTDRIRAQALTVDHVRDIETLLVRTSGLEYFVDIHIEVDGDLSVDEGHRIAHAVKDHLMAQFPAIRDVLVHIEPHPSPIRREYDSDESGGSDVLSTK